MLTTEEKPYGRLEGWSLARGKDFGRGDPFYVAVLRYLRDRYGAGSFYPRDVWERRSPCDVLWRGGYIPAHLAAGTIDMRFHGIMALVADQAGAVGHAALERTSTGHYRLTDYARRLLEAVGENRSHVPGRKR